MKAARAHDQTADFKSFVRAGTTAFYDRSRVKNDEIAEHRDPIEIIPDRAEWTNRSGKFLRASAQF